MESYAGPIRRLCGAYAASAADREDLCQDIFVAVWRALPGYRGDASLRTWLYRIAHNVALTWQARERRRQSRETHLDAEVPSRTLPRRSMSGTGRLPLLEFFLEARHEIVELVDDRPHRVRLTEIDPGHP